MGSEEGLADLVSLLDDSYARHILAETSREPLSAEELADRCDASEATIYRRLEALEEADLVAATQELDPDGHHYQVHRARLDRLTVELEDGEYRVEVERTDRDVADRFTELVEGLK